MRFLLGISLCLLSLPAFSQEKCAFVPYNKQLAEKMEAPESEAAFEKWMLHKKQHLQQQMRTAGSTAANARYVIPVVVHVIHRQGEAPGQGANIPEAQILSQLKILNDDFRALNQTDINKLSTQFKTLVADTEIEFVLARQDPEGVETNGIVRVAASRQNWSQSDDLELKSLSQWPPDQYLNLYVAPLSFPTLGWAQFPQSDKLPGLNLGDTSEASDGVVIDYRYLGTGGQAVSGSKGRTATHEIGHYFGLRHIWGDGGCNVDDYVTDTPQVGKENTGCPPGDAKEEDKPKACNGNPAMYQNYMDYSDDACMALFTLGQKERMLVVLENSPRRKALHYSPGKEAPTVVADDAGLRQLTLTAAQLCNSTYTPNLEVRNYGNTQVTQVEVVLTIDNQPAGTYSLQTNLGYLQTQVITLDPITIENPGQREIIANITLTNNTRDGKASNNTITANLDVPQQIGLPLTHDFESGVFPFYIINPDARSYTWEQKDVPNGMTSNNTAAFINFYDYAQTGHKDILASPVFNLSDERYLFFSMNVSHARYDRTTADGLEIYVSTDCSTNLQTADLVYSAAGANLATTNSTTAAFAPEDASQWRSIGLDLSAYAGMPNIQILLVGVNDYGNNLYLDDILVSNMPVAPLNVSLSEIAQPTAVFGQEESPLKVRLKNSGSETIESLRFKITLNGETLADIDRSNMGLEPLDSREITLMTLSELPSGPHTLEVLAYSPNGGTDAIGADDQLKKQFVVNMQQRRIPLRETLNVDTFMDTESLWSSLSTDLEEQGWVSLPILGPFLQQAATNHAAAAQYMESTSAHEKWLASPVLSLRHTPQAGLQFWYYAGGAGALSLKVLASRDGGLTWPHVVWEKAGNELKINGDAGAPEPLNDASWTKAFINLLDFTGYDNIRFAFVATGNKTASVYVDEIEFSLSDVPTDIPLPDRNSVSLFPNPTRGDASLFFNLENPEGENVQVSLLNSNGSYVRKYSFPNTINQIYSLDLPDLAAGIYYLRIRSTSINTTRKLVLVR